MANTLITRELTIGELLARPGGYGIPAYQREYAWEGDEARRLVEDVHGAMLDMESGTSAHPYFLGTVLLCAPATAAAAADTAGGATVAGPAGPAAGGATGGAPLTTTPLAGGPPDAAQPTAQPPGGPVDVVDGQQRLITLAILYACLRDRLGDVAIAALIAGPRLRLREADIAYFERAVLASGATSRNIPKPDEQASTTHKNILGNRNVLRHYLRSIGKQECERLARFLTHNCNVVALEADDVDYAYQIFLSINERGKDLTVEDIFQAEVIGPLAPAELARYGAIIGQVGRFGRENRQNVARAKTFFTHLSAAQGWSSRNIVKALRDRIRDAGGPQGFKAAVLVPMADTYMGVLGLVPASRQLGASAEAALDNLRLLETHGDDDWIATAMLALMRFSNPDDLDAVLGELDRYAHVMAALGFGGTPRKQRYKPINEKLRAGAPAATIVGLMAWPDAELKAAVRNIAQKLYAKDDDTCRLVLLRIDAAVSGRPLSYYRALPGFSRTGTDRLSIEHLIPKARTLKPDAERAWAALFKSNAHRQLCAQYLGNLALVAESDNRAVDQIGFPDKMQTILRTTPHPIATTEMLRDCASWDVAEMAKRHRLLMDTALRLWRLPAPYPVPA